MKSLKCLLLVLVARCCQAEIDEEAMMIADVIHAMERPSSVIATLCWPLNKRVHLYSTLANDNVTQIMMQFMKIGDMPEGDNEDHHIVLLADLGCPDIASYFQMSHDKKYFRSPFRWLLTGVSKMSEDNEMIIPPALDNITILPDSEVVMAIPMGDGSFVAHQVFKISDQSDWRTEHYGNWDVRNRFQRSRNLIESTAMRRIDLDGLVIPISYVVTDNDSINHMDDGINDHIDTITKVNFPTTNHLLDFLNAGRRYVFVNSWGYLINGTWNGMTGELVREEVEIGGSPMFFTQQRQSIVEYIASPTSTRPKFVFQQPKLSYENNLFLLSFRAAVWYCSIALIFLLFIGLIAVTVWEWKINGDKYEQRMRSPGVLRDKVSDIAILLFGAICQQGSPAELKGSLGRMVMLVLFLALMFLYTSYAANIVALLQSSSSQIRTLEDLLNSRIKFGVHDTVYSRYYFAASTERVRRAIYLKKVAPPGMKPRFMSLEEGVKNIRKGLFAFHMETGVGYKLVGKYFHEGEKCGLKEILYLQVIDPWLAVRKYTPFKEMFKIGFKRIHEHGLQSRQNLLLYEKRPKCSGRGANFISVSMVDCYPALLVLAYGVIAALGMLAIEILAHKKRKLKINVCCFSSKNEL